MSARAELLNVTRATVKVWREGAKVCLRFDGREIEVDMEIEPAAIAEYERIAAMGNPARGDEPIFKEWYAWARCAG